MTSISSESSLWDDRWYSLVHVPEVRASKSSYTATLRVDLRHSDSLIINKSGRLMVDLGGEFGDTELPDEVVSIIDGYKVSKVFTVLQDARSWQEAMVLRIRVALSGLRSRFYSGDPGDFDQRHRRV